MDPRLRRLPDRHAAGSDRALRHRNGQRSGADAGKKTDPFGFFAPELSKTLIVAIEDQRRVVVYEPESADVFIRRATIELPADAEPFVYSVEPFSTQGHSYFTLHAQADQVTPPKPTVSSIWLLSMDPIDGERIVRRVDDGQSAHRIDPEWFIGENEVFVYFNILPGAGAGWQVHRCRAGVST